MRIVIMAMNNIEIVFFSKNNLENTYNQVAEELLRRTNKNISNNSNYKKTFDKMAHMVFDKIPMNDRNLMKCNTLLVEKTVAYFHNKIFNKNIREDVPIANTISRAGVTMMRDNNDVTAKMNELMNNRNTSTRNIQEQDQKLNRVNKPSIQNIDFTIQPFNMNDELTDTLNCDTPLYQNIENLQKMNSANPMQLLDEYTKQRQNVVFTRNDVDSQTKIDQTQVDPMDLFNFNNELTNNYMDHIEKNIVNNDSAQPSLTQDQIATTQNILVTTQRDTQPKYIEKVHYININSVDRNWINNNKETRYNFQVKFNQNQDYQGGATISNMYRNIISVELVSAVMPMDAYIDPFDTRIYMGLSRYPYLLLRVDELDNVFKGTNNWVDKAFSTMIFDKVFFTNTLSTEYITGSSSIVQSTPKQGFMGEYLRGFMKYNPAYFEKKKFYNNPLANLNRMTIDITDPRGNFVNVQKDVLDITSIAFTGNVALVTNTELIPTYAWPYSTQGSYSYVKLTTTTYFSNRLFRIGDRIIINNFVFASGHTGANDSKFQEFINRPQGHIILNLDVETNGTANTNNRGFINGIYISPPGEMDTTNNTVDPATYYNDSSLDLSTVDTWGRLINVDMQTQLMFRIVTRDPDTNNTINPINIY